MSHRTQLNKYFAFVDRQLWDEMFALFHPDVIYHRGDSPPIVGIDELKAFYRGGRLIATGRHVVELLLVDGDWAVAKGTFAGTLKDGADVSVRFVDLHEFRDGLIWRRHTYFAGRAV